MDNLFGLYLPMTVLAVWMIWVTLKIMMKGGK